MSNEYVNLIPEHRNFQILKTHNNNAKHRRFQHKPVTLKLLKMKNHKETNKKQERKKKTE